jgi:alanine racemase
MTMKSNIVCVRSMGKGETISYGRTYETPANSVIATIPAGYADGYIRLLSNCGQIQVNGELVPIVGRICMDQFMVDVSRVKPRPKDGDEVILFGDVPEISADDIAKNAETINYEIVSQINKRVPRIYI